MLPTHFQTSADADSVPDGDAEVANPAIDSARYIADLTGELADMARRLDLDMIAYLLDITTLEATRTARRLGLRAR